MSATTEVTGALRALIRGEDLSGDSAAAVMHAMMGGELTSAQIAGLLVAWRAKGETADEIAGLARTMRDFALTVHAPDGAVDTCGTGGDGAGTFNISTVAALVVAGAGVPVVKHGNRAASGRCGSADLLEAWGIVIDLPPDGVETTIAESGIGFCFAPVFHPAMRHVMPTRKELGIPTVFNYLGPITNPGAVRHQTIGVSDATMAAKTAGVLARLGVDHALVFHADDGLDELTTTAASQVWEIRGEDVNEWRFDPAEIGLPAATLDDIRGGDIAENRAIAEKVLEGTDGPALHIVCLAAGAALYAADRVDSIASGVDLAAATVDEGRAAAVLERWVESSREAAATP